MQVSSTNSHRPPNWLQNPGGFGHTMNFWRWTRTSRRIGETHPTMTGHPPQARSSAVLPAHFFGGLGRGAGSHALLWASDDASPFMMRERTWSPAGPNPAGLKTGSGADGHETLAAVIQRSASKDPERLRGQAFRWHNLKREKYPSPK